METTTQKEIENEASKRRNVYLTGEHGAIAYREFLNGANFAERLSEKFISLIPNGNIKTHSCAKFFTKPFEAVKESEKKQLQEDIEKAESAIIEYSHEIVELKEKNKKLKVYVERLENACSGLKITLDKTIDNYNVDKKKINENISQLEKEKDMTTLFDIEEVIKQPPVAFCRTCIHKENHLFNKTIIKYCGILKSNRTANGQLKIKDKTPACRSYKPKFEKK